MVIGASFDVVFLCSDNLKLCQGSLAYHLTGRLVGRIFLRVHVSDHRLYFIF